METLQEDELRGSKSADLGAGASEYAHLAVSVPEQRLPATEAIAETPDMAEARQAVDEVFSSESPLSVEREGTELESRLADVEAQITAIREQYPVSESGGSSFYDVTGNILSVAKPCFRYWKEQSGNISDDPDEVEDLASALDDATESIIQLERYLKAVTSDPAVLHAEMTMRDGAYPELRQKADDLLSEGLIKRPIPYYIDELEKAVNR